MLAVQISTVFCILTKCKKFVKYVCVYFNLMLASSCYIELKVHTTFSKPSNAIAVKQNNITSALAVNIFCYRLYLLLRVNKDDGKDVLKRRLCELTILVVILK